MVEKELFQEDDYDVEGVLENTEDKAETTEVEEKKEDIVEKTKEVTSEAKAQPEESSAPSSVDEFMGETEPEIKTTVLEAEKPKEVEVLTSNDMKGSLFVIRTTANREDQVFDFLGSNIEQKKIPIFSIIRAHGMRGYIFIEAPNESEAQRAIYGVPYARGILGKPVGFEEIESMLETVKTEVNIRKGDIVEIIAGPFKREKAKISRVDKQKEDVIVELLEAAVSIPITLKFDAVKVIRREDEGDDEEIVFDD